MGTFTPASPLSSCSISYGAMSSMTYFTCRFNIRLNKAEICALIIFFKLRSRSSIFIITTRIQTVWQFSKIPHDFSFCTGVDFLLDGHSLKSKPRKPSNQIRQSQKYIHTHIYSDLCFHFLFGYELQKVSYMCI